ncbi:Na+/H+ antiporter subunit G [Coralloluteibacterium thermophilus]|uniref:Na+/H+ antiporter subunit G n=1 Tax=Coralloluteibacterium thermophilum TaxID=2707049 RepID=A0ABV9NJJ6_9GAMM
MNPSVVVEFLVSALILVGAGFMLVGSLGLAKLSEIYKRLHGPAKATTVGIGALLVASIVRHTLLGEGLHLRELLVTAFLFLTAPVSAHLMARAALALDPDARPKIREGRAPAPEG